MEGINKVSKESLQKALETLGLAEEVVEQTTTDEQEEEVEVEEDAELQKAMDDLEALQGRIEALKNKTAPAVPVNDNSELIKGLEDKIGAFATLVQSKDEKIEELSKAIKDIAAFNETLGKKIGLIASQPLERKSVSTASYIEKGGDSGQGNGGASDKVFSLSDKKQRAELADIVFKAAIKDGAVSDNEFAKAVPCIELGSLGATPMEAQRLSARLKAEHKIIVTK